MRTIVYGNGKSRQKWNVNEKLDNVVTWGCNRIFNDVKVDNLVAVDYHVQHLIYESGYAHENKCWFADWNKLPQYFHDSIRHMYEYTNIIENKRGNRQNCVINSGGTNNGLYIIWVDEEDMVTPIDFPREWDSGTTAIHLACQEGYDEVYLLGFDLDPSRGIINNIYKGTQNYENSDAKESKWKIDVQKEKMKVIFNEFKNTKFIWAEPQHDTQNFSFNNLTYETYDNIY